MEPILQVKTTPGVGDYMYPLNKAFMLSRRLGHSFHVEFYWNHNEDYLHHFEDPETIVERFNYTLPFYRDSCSLSFSHHFNSPRKHPKLERKRFVPNDDLRRLGSNSLAKVENGTAQWAFNDNRLQEQEDKIVIWRPLFNAEIPRQWKRMVTNEMWDQAIDFLRSIGYNVVELSYRSPIREAHYHIATCKLVISYDGMWHYFAKNYYKPMIVASRSAITRLHTPHALTLHEIDSEKGKTAFRHFNKQIEKLHVRSKEYRDLTLLDFLIDKANRYKQQFEDFYHSYR